MAGQMTIATHMATMPTRVMRERRTRQSFSCVPVTACNRPLMVFCFLMASSFKETGPHTPVPVKLSLVPDVMASLRALVAFIVLSAASIEERLRKNRTAAG
jgi:Fe2+ transport system protein B